MYITAIKPNGTTVSQRIDGRGRNHANTNIAICRVTGHNTEIADRRTGIAFSTERRDNAMGALNNGSIVTVVCTSNTYRDGEPHAYNTLSVYVINDGAANHHVIRTTDINHKVAGTRISTDYAFDQRVSAYATDDELVSMMQTGAAIWRAAMKGLCSKIDECEDAIKKHQNTIDSLEYQMEQGNSEKYEILTAVKDDAAAKRWIKNNNWVDGYTIVTLPTR